MAIFKDSRDNPLKHDRSLEDRKRHRQLVEKSIKENLGDILSEESITKESKNKKFKIPIKGIKEYQFVFGKNNRKVSTGTGNEKRGDKVGGGKSINKNGKGGAGNTKGEDVYETEITMEELMEYIIEDLELPNLDKKKFSEIVIESSGKRKGYKRYGINPRISKKRTIMSKIARKQGLKRILKEESLIGDIKRLPFKEEDLRYFRVNKKPKKESNAVIIFIMDVSGSMDSTKKYLARSLFFVLSKFIKRRYINIKFEFISHTTTAKNVSEYEFFHKAESGGTYISSGLNLALDIIGRSYPKDRWNIYTIYGSDGDNWSEDNEKAVDALKKLCNISNMLAYAELLPSTYSTTMYYRFTKEVTQKNFISIIVKEKKDLWDALRLMLSKELGEN